MALEHVERKLAAILAADVAGYSRLTGADEEGTMRRLRALRAELIDPAIQTHRGHIVKTMGDGFLVEFQAWSTPCAVFLKSSGACRRDTQISSRINGSSSALGSTWVT